MPARLNRRRYRECVNALKQIISSPRTPPQRKLRAVETLLGIYDRHDQSELRRLRRQTAEAQQSGTISDTEQPEPVIPGSGIATDPEESAREFLDRLREEAMTND